ncbi:lysylphosphatidylglycerol synthase transmembrane domain-containing protein [Rhizocola hellebori]|nr:lysylphosphatidylglycerol synthase transmembrane domain-containing protein [Rhizocola hellebori]
MWTWARNLLGIGILAWLGWRLGTGPFLDGVRAIDRSSLVVATVIGAVTTSCCAWRWRLVAGGLGVRLPMREAVAACYRSQFLNMTLPGGVVGDVHRAVRHGRDVGDVGLGVQAVVLERVAGHVVQVVLAVTVLAAFPSPVRSHLPAVLAVLAAVGLVVAVLAFGVSRGGSIRWVAALARSLSRMRLGLLTPRLWAGVVFTSAVVLAGQLATFVLAARVSGSAAPLALLVPLTLFALMAMAVPLHVAGWGLREGAAAWVFGAAGLTATQGVATAVTYGVLTLVAGLPGAAVLLFGRLGARTPVAALAQGEANG